MVFAFTRAIPSVCFHLAALVSITRALLTGGPPSNTVPLGPNVLPIFNNSTGNNGYFAIFNPPPSLYTGANQLIQNCSTAVLTTLITPPDPSAWFCVSVANLLVKSHSHTFSSTVAILQPWKAPTTYSAIFEGDNGTTFEIGIPSDLCPHAVLGDLQSPQGDAIVNATPAVINDVLSALSIADQTTYLSRLLTNAIDALQAELDALVCSEALGGSRALLWNYVESQNMKGWSYWITGSTLTAGIIFTTAMVPNGWSPYDVHIGWAAKSGILAAGGSVQLGLVFLWNKLFADGMFHSIDYGFVNIFIAAANGFTAGLKLLGRACVSLASVKQALIDLYNQCQCCGPQAIGPNPGDQALPAANQPEQPGQPGQPVQPQADPQLQPAAVLPQPECSP